MSRVGVSSNSLRNIVARPSSQRGTVFPVRGRILSLFAKRDERSGGSSKYHVSTFFCPRFSGGHPVLHLVMLSEVETSLLYARKADTACRVPTGGCVMFFRVCPNSTDLSSRPCLRDLCPCIVPLSSGDERLASEGVTFALCFFFRANTPVRPYGG